MGIIKTCIIIMILLGIIFITIISKENIQQIIKKDFDDIDVFLLSLFAIIILIILLIIIIKIF